MDETTQHRKPPIVIKEIALQHGGDEWRAGTVTYTYRGELKTHRVEIHARVLDGDFQTVREELIRQLTLIHGLRSREV